MPGRIDLAEIINRISFPEGVWEWLDLMGDAGAAAQEQAMVHDKQFLADTPYKKLLRQAINKDLTTLSAIYVLLRCELIHEAASHVRLFCESVITLRHIALDPEVRAKLFLEYYHVEVYELATAFLEIEGSRAHPHHVAQLEALRANLVDNYEKYKPQYTFIDKRKRRRRFMNWCNKNIGTQARECGPDLDRLYNLVYKQLSAYIHGSAWSLRRQISYRRDRYQSDVVLNDVATIVRAALMVWAEWADFCERRLGWKLSKVAHELATRLEALDAKHFPAVRL